MVRFDFLRIFKTFDVCFETFYKKNPFSISIKSMKYGYDDDVANIYGYVDYTLVGPTFCEAAYQY